MLSFYERDPELVRESVQRVAALGIDRLVAVDGRYDLHPGAEDDSTPACYHEITLASRGAEVEIFSKRAWGAGNEVEKRNFMLEKTLLGAEKGDWLLVFDADHMWEQVWSSLRLHDVLSCSESRSPCENLAAEVALADCSLDDPSPSWYQARLLLRAVPGMRYEGAHWRVAYPDGRVVTTLRTGRQETTAKVIDLTHNFRVRHTVFHQDDKRRRERQGVYYLRRENEGIEN